MIKNKSINTQALAEKARASENKETCQGLEKTPVYRIAVGARAPLTTTPSFFVEVIVNLPAEDGEVDLQQLERVLACLKALKARGYALTFEDGNCISCETKKPPQNLNREYLTVRALLKSALA